jgi:hypothetical protein
MTSPQDELRRIDELLARRGAADAEPLGVALTFDSLSRRRDQLHGRLSDQDLHLALRRPGRSTGGETSFLADVLGALQDSIASVAQALSVGATRAAPIPAHIRDAVELRVVSAAAGSLDLRLAAAYPSDQMPLFHEASAPPLLDAAVERVLRVLDHATSERDEVLSEIADLGQRATNHLDALSRSLANAEASALVEWRTPRTSVTTSIDAHAASLLHDVLSEVHEEARTHTVVGRLVGGSLPRRTFELELPDESVIRGKVAEEALASLGQFSLGERCSAELETRLISLSSGEMKESHQLLSLERAD